MGVYADFRSTFHRVRLRSGRSVGQSVGLSDPKHGKTNAMTLLGLVLFLIGAIAAGLMTLGIAPGVLLNLGLSAPMWLGVSVAGAALLWFNRRPGG